MRQIFLVWVILALSGFMPGKTNAQEVSVVLTTDEGFSNPAIIEKMQHNLSRVLTEINRAQKENRCYPVLVMAGMLFLFRLVVL